MKKLRCIKIVFLLLLFSCNKKKTNESVNPSNQIDSTKKGTDDFYNDLVYTGSTGGLLLHLHAYIDQTELDGYNFDYNTENGKTISISMGQLFLSSIELIKLDGSIIKVPKRFVLKTNETSTYNLGKVPVGNYKSIRFKVGLDSLTRSLSTNRFSDSLLLNNQTMWMNTNWQKNNYLGAIFEGNIDTSNSNTKKMAKFSYKINADKEINITMPEHRFTVVLNQSDYLHLLADYSILFNEIDLKNKNNLLIDYSNNANTLLIKNISKIFRYE